MWWLLFCTVKAPSICKLTGQAFIVCLNDINAKFSARKCAEEHKLSISRSDIHFLYLLNTVSYILYERSQHPPFTLNLSNGLWSIFIGA